MENAPRQNAFSALARHRLLLGVVVAVTLVQVAVSLWAMRTVQRQIAYSANAIVQSRVEQLETSFTSLSSNLKRRLVAQGQLSLLEQAQSADTMSRLQARRQLIDDLFYITGTADSEYSLFYFFPQSGEFVTGVHSRYIGFAQRPFVQEGIARLVASGYKSNSTSARWALMEAGGEFYAVQLYQYQNVWIGSCIPSEVLIRPLNGVYLEGESLPVLFTAEGRLAAGADALAAAGLPPENAVARHGTFWHDGQRWLAVEPVDSIGGFQIKLFLKGYGQFETIVLAQACVLFVVAFVLSLVILTMSYTQKRILRPLRRFTEGLKTYDPDKPLLLETDTELAELASANEQFNNLIKEIRRLRIDVYEKEIAHQKIQMDYMQMQIQPHFFLNNLSIINAMARRKDCEGIAGLSQATTNYLRYIFQSDKALAAVGEELQHIRDYLSVMRIRYPDRFAYDILAEDEAMEQTLPPLLLQTFVENALKHGMTVGRAFELSISVLMEAMDGQEALTIFITDNGCGFSPECLQAWQSGRELPRMGNEHIGIANARRRLELAYQGRARLMLYNSPLGGAVVELHIPCKEEKDEPAVCRR